MSDQDFVHVGGAEPASDGSMLSLGPDDGNNDGGMDNVQRPFGDIVDASSGDELPAGGMSNNASDKIRRYAK